MKYKTFYNQDSLNKWIEKNGSKIDYSIIYGQEDNGTPVYIVEFKKLRKVY